MDNSIRRQIDTDINSIDSNYSVNRHEDRDSWKVMFEHLYSDISRLLERESLLIRTEVNEKISDVKVAAGSMIVGGSLLLVGGLAAVATAIIALDYVMPLWASALLVTAVLLVVGGIMVAGAKKKLEADKLKPKQSLETLGEIKTTFKERINEFKHH